VPRYIDHDQRRRDVIVVATDLVVTGGRSALTIRSLAEAAGWSTKAVSHYFTDMAELLHATYTAAADRAKLRIDAVTAGDPTDVQGFVEALLPMDAERRRDWAIWFAFWSEALTSDRLGADQRERARSNTERIRRMLDRRRVEQRIDPACDVAEASRRLSALIPGVAGLAMFDPKQWTAARQREIVAGELRLLGVGP
jgi:AcrR family transcriptional regulator